MAGKSKKRVSKPKLSATTRSVGRPILSAKTENGKRHVLRRPGKRD